MKTLLHKNLHNGLWVVTQRGLVVGYCDGAVLVDVDCKVDKKKAAFSRTGGKRTVHLWLRGTLADVVGFVPFKGRELVYSPCDYPLPNLAARYNPKRGEPGFMVNGALWESGPVASVGNQGMLVL